MDNETPVVDTGTVVVGRQDYGRGWQAREVMVLGEPFAVVKIRGGAERWYTPCGFCDPTWSGSKSWAAHVLAGVCFQCNGAGTAAHRDDEAGAVKMVRNRIRARERAADKREAAAVAQAAALAAWREANAETIAMLAPIIADRPENDAREDGRFETEEAEDAYYTAVRAWEQTWGDFLTSVAVQSQYRALSERQVAAIPNAVRRAMADREETAAREAAQRFYGVPGEKIADVEGTVVVRSSYDTFYGGRAKATCLLVITGHGDYTGVTFKITGTAASLWTAEKGDTVTLSGKIKRHGVYEGTKQTEVTYAKIGVLASA